MATNPWKILSALTVDLQDRLPLDALLRRVVETGAQLLDTDRVSVRLLDPSRTRLLASCRAGSPVHQNPNIEFRLGEGLIGWIAAEVKPLRSGDAERDPRFVPRDDVKERLGSFLGVPIVAGRTCLGVLSALHPAADRFDEQAEDVLMLLAGICAPHLEAARLERLSQVDPLTGAFNRRALEIAFSVSDDGGDEPTSVVMVDVDHFKRINDEYGHAIGDEALKRVAAVLSSGLRAGDAVIRYGGEEFLLVLPHVRLDVAAKIAERARVAVENVDIDAGGVRFRVTISAGVAERRRGESRDEVIGRADDALYNAKQNGRNRVVTADRRRPPSPE
jgi:diguanylate cyclase (GGDEF)-like protein